MTSSGRAVVSYGQSSHSGVSGGTAMFSNASRNWASTISAWPRPTQMGCPMPRTGRRSPRCLSRNSCQAGMIRAGLAPRPAMSAHATPAASSPRASRRACSRGSGTATKIGCSRARPSRMNGTTMSTNSASPRYSQHSCRYVRSARAHRTYRHECWLYRGDAEFVDMVVPFIRDGLAREQPILVAVPEPRLHALRDALGDDAAGVAWADMAGLGANPARIIPAWQEFLDKHRGDRRPVRGIGQPIWVGRGQAEIVEAQFLEALLNMAVPPDTPLWLLCPYDTTALPDDVIDAALRSHPVLADTDGYRGSTHYGGAHHANLLFSKPLPEPAAPTTVIAFDPDRHRHSDRPTRAAVAAGVTADQATELATA